MLCHHVFYLQDRALYKACDCNDILRAQELLVLGANVTYRGPVSYIEHMGVHVGYQYTELNLSEITLVHSRLIHCKNGAIIRLPVRDAHTVTVLPVLRLANSASNPL